MAVVPPRHMYVFGDQNIFWDCCGPNAGGSIRLCFQQDMQKRKPDHNMRRDNQGHERRP